MDVPKKSDGQHEPARPSSLSVQLIEEPDLLTIHRRNAGGPSAFLFLWLIGWTVACVALIVNVLKEPAIVNIMFGLPFWASWFFVAGMLVWMKFGIETLTLTPTTAYFQRTAFIRLNSREVPRAEIKSFRECRSSHTENDQYLWGIEMNTVGKPLQFAFRLPERERDWLIDRLNGFLASTNPLDSSLSERAEPRQAADVPATESSMQKVLSATEIITKESTVAEPPTDSRWQLIEGFDAFNFVHRGEWNSGVATGLLFINCFWNGIVSVFVGLLFGWTPDENPPQGWEWWGLFVFLIPFEAIGLAMFAGLVFCVLEPWHRIEWRFERHQLARLSRWPIFRRLRVWDVTQLDRLELRRTSDDKNAERSRSIATFGQGDLSLALITTNNVDLCTIPNLTEGEVRWFARLIFTRRPHWLAS